MLFCTYTGYHSETQPLQMLLFPPHSNEILLAAYGVYKLGSTKYPVIPPSYRIFKKPQVSITVIIDLIQLVTGNNKLDHHLISSGL